MILKVNRSKSISAFIHHLKKGFIFLSLIVLISCSCGSKRVPTDPETVPPEAGNTTPIQTQPVRTIKEHIEDGNIIEGEFSDAQYTAAQKLVDQAPKNAEVYAAQGVIQSVITGSTEVAGQTPEERVITYFSENAELYNLGQFSQNFEEVKKFEQPSGAQVRQYQQIVGGIPVYQSDLRVTLDAEGRIALVNSNYMTDSVMPQSLEPKLSPEQAIAVTQALEFDVSKDVTPTLVIYSPSMVGQEGLSFLAWLVKAAWEGGFGNVIINDSDGSLVSMNNDIKTTSNQIQEYKTDIFSLKQSFRFLRDSSELLPDFSSQVIEKGTRFTYEIRDFEGDEMPEIFTAAEIDSKPLLASSTNQEKENPSRVSHLIDQLDQIFGYYRDSLDYYKYNRWTPWHTSDIKILVNISYNSGFSYYVINSIYAYPLIGFTIEDAGHNIDTLAHEFQHIVTKDFVTLDTNIKTPHASALNEAFSDFFAAVADTSDRRWQIELEGKLLRDMQNPKASGNPDHLDSFDYPSQILAKLLGEAFEDYYGNGHINSTIVSHALYLLSEGGQKRNINILGIGIDNVAQIVFHSLALMNDNANFQQARNAMLLTCENLVHEGNTPESYCFQLKNALAAVGIGAPASLFEEGTSPEDEEIVVAKAEPVHYEQIKVWNWGSPEIFLTYDVAKWDASDEESSIASKFIAGCFIIGNGYREGPDWYKNYDFETVTELVGGIEYRLEKEILKTTGVPEMTHVYWISQEGGWQNQLALFTSPEKYQECVTSFWEVMELSHANNFTTSTDEIPTADLSSDSIQEQSVPVNTELTTEVITSNNLNKLGIIERFDVFANGIKWTDDGTKLIISMCNDKTTVYSGKDLKEMNTIGDISCPMDMDISPDGKLVVFGGKFLVDLFDIKHAKLLLTYDVEIDYVTADAFSADNSKLAVGGEDLVIVWELKTGEELLKAEFDMLVLEDLEFSPDGKYLASGGQKGLSSMGLRVWDLENGTEIYTSTKREGSTSTVKFTNDGSKLIFDTGLDLVVLDLNTFERVQLLEGHQYGISDIDISPDGKLIASCDQKGNIFFWDAITGEKLYDFSASGYANNMSLSPDGKLLVYISGYREVLFLGIP